MPEKEQQSGDGAIAESANHAHLSAKQQKERKDRVLTKGAPSVVSSIADAIVLKDSDLFLLTSPDSSLPLKGGHGYGLYYHDCRYLSGYELKVAGVKPGQLVASAEQGRVAGYELTNPDIRMEDGTLIEKEHIGIKLRRLLDGRNLMVADAFSICNYALEEYRFPITIGFKALFEDVFAVRGLLPEKLGKLRPPRWDDGELELAYDGADGIFRSVRIAFSEKPEVVDDTVVRFQISLGSRAEKQLSVSLALLETDDTEKAEDTNPSPNVKLVHSALREETEKLHHNDHRTEIRSDSLLLNGVIERSMRDLHMLQSMLDDEQYFAAGLPWFGTIFGRDSLITSMQMLAYEPAITGRTLRLLADYQGDKVDEWRDAQPGKILHELRVGEMAHTGQIPHTPYYGTIDATPLFLILMGLYSDWTGDITLFKDLRSNVERALEWIDKYGDTTGDGYTDYESTSEKGLINQGWKDSGDAIVNADGSLARPPIALVEVQGYVYSAKKTIAGLYRCIGETERADALEKQAQELRSRFNNDFWLAKRGFFALALQKDGEPCVVRSSNPGQALWTGIVDEDKARSTVDMLMSGEMYNGWGIRTLSVKAMRYNPIAYHLGTVWPHDNSIIAAGFRRYGFDKEARQVSMGIMEAAMHFDNYRLPELFAGFDRASYGVPVHYPVACHPQAWAAGSVPFMLTTLLGLTPEGFENRLRIVRPILLDFIDRIDVCGLRVGKGVADLRFTRRPEGGPNVEVLKTDGDLEVKVEQ